MDELLPDNVRMDYRLFYTSDSIGVDYVVRMGNLKRIVKLKDGAPVTPGLLSLAPDMRPMTADEVNEYIRQEQEDTE